MCKKVLPASKYDAKYDIVKFILSLLVLAIHAGLYPMVLYPWLRIAVPLFFMLSSFFLFSKINHSDPENSAKIIKGFVLRNLQLYILWFVILMPITLYIRKEEIVMNDFFGMILAFIKAALFEGLFTASWFIPAIIIGVLLVYMLHTFIKNDYVLSAFFIAVFILATLASSYVPVIKNTFLYSVIETYDRVFGRSMMLSFPMSLLWVHIGKMIAEQKIKNHSWDVLAVFVICSCVCLFVEWKFVISLDGSFNNDSYFMLVPLCTFLFLGIQKIKPVHWPGSIHLKRASTVIYVTHASILRAVSGISFILFGTRDPLLLFIITFIFSISVYILLVCLINKCKSHRMKTILQMLY